MKGLLIAVITLTGVFATAAGRNEAATICQKMKFDSERNKCVATVGRHEYYDLEAINVCKTIKFDSEMNSCLEAIGDKTYEAYEIENCAKISFDSDKALCMRNTGKPYPVTPPGCMDKKGLIQELHRLDRIVYDGDIYYARNVIYDLITHLQRCP